MKLYGSLDNRLEEGKQYCEVIEVGTGVTEYGWSDRKPYEVTRVINQKHVFIRPMNYKRIDNNGMSDSQDYEYISNPEGKEIEVEKRGSVWYEVKKFSKSMWEEKAKNDKCFKTTQVAYNYYKGMAGLTEKQNEAIEQGKEVKRYKKMDISFGVMERYYDYSF